ncbi:hypothetical protein ACOSQ4_027288 [Xanthoceras sorbifolium]
MSFEAGPSKSLSSSSSSSSSSNPEEEVDLTALIEAQSQLAHAQHRAMLNVYANNNLLMAYYLNQQDSDQPSRGGSIPGHNVIHRGREEAAHNLWADYFAENPRYNELMFRRRFRMSRSLFLRIANEVERHCSTPRPDPARPTRGALLGLSSSFKTSFYILKSFHDNYFVQRRDGLGRLGLSSLQKITSMFRMLAYGVPADSTDEYIKIGESTAIESMKRFCRAVVEVFGKRYLRSPNAYDVARLLQIGEKRGLAPPAHYVIQGKEYNTGYYLADGIYPKWSTLVQTIHDPRGPKKRLFAMKQEACRKDVERAFGVLQSRFAIVKGPARFWNKHVLHDIMSSCIIMHNMIVEDERDVDADIDNWREAPAPEVDMQIKCQLIRGINPFNLILDEN